MPINFGSFDREASQLVCQTLKQKFAEGGLTIPSTRFFRSSRGDGCSLRVPNHGQLFIYVDLHGRCKISVPTNRGRRYVKKVLMSLAYNTFMTKYGNQWIREDAERRRASVAQNQQSELMKATLERVLSAAGLVFNERRATMSPSNRRFTCREVEFQGLALSLEGLIENAIPTFTSVSIRGGTTNVRINKLVRALTLLTGQQPCPV